MQAYTHLTKFEGKLYRYQPYSGSYIDYVNELILHNKVFYSNPLQFNDPFDCKLYGIKFSEDSIVRFIRERAKRTFDTKMPSDSMRPSPQLLDELLEKTIKDGLPKVKEDCAREIHDLHNLVEKDIGVLCLTSDPLNILMYSHYADRHQGVCLEFTLGKDNLLNPEPVRYTEDFPTLEFSLSHKANLELSIALVSTKSTDWEYEHEHRSLRTGGAGIVEIPDHYLSGIIFGCEAKEETIQTMLSVAEKSSKALNFYKAVKSESSFSLFLEKMF